MQGWESDLEEDENEDPTPPENSSIYLEVGLYHSESRLSAREWKSNGRCQILPT